MWPLTSAETKGQVDRCCDRGPQILRWKRLVLDQKIWGVWGPE